MFIILLLVLTQISYGCSVLDNDTIYITATPGEKVDIKVSEILRDKNIKQYTVSPTSELYSISTPLTLIQQSQYNQMEPRELISSKLHKSSGYLDITNQITILSKKGQNKYFIEYNSVMFENTPEIDIVQEVDVKDNSICYDTVQVDQLYIIECNNVDGDYFAILNKDQVQFMTIANSQRQLRKLDQLDNYILRNLYDSLELYQLQDNQLVLLSTLNTQLLRQLTRDNKFELLIVDFTFHTNQQITILNQQGQFICLKFMPQQWELYEYLQTQTNLPYAYDYSWKYLQLVIISEKSIYLRQLSSWTQKDNLKFDLNNKVQLSQNYIIIQKEKSLDIINLSFQEIQSINTKIQGFLNSFQAFDSFLFFDNQNFQAYTINQDNQNILRFQSNQIINDYKLFKITFQLPYNICIIQCYFKVVDLATKDIYQQVSISNSFFQGGLLLDEPQSLQFTQPFVGQSLKIEFTPTQFMTIQFSRSKKVEILNAGDPKDVIYRKIIPEIGSTSFIEQNKNLQITGYTCNLITNQLQCQIFIQKHDFIKLQDSPLQTWFTQFYTYLAIGNNKNLDLYCNCNDQFQISLLKTLTIDSNIKEIKHSFSFLLILVDQEVLAYQINNNKQRLVFRHLAEKVFTSANLDLVWIYEKKKLYLFDISDNAKLLHFTYLKDYDDIEVGVSKNQFLLLAKRDNQYQAFVYDYQNLKFTYIVKELNLSGYTQLKLCLACNQQSNFIYLEAQKNGNKVLLIYRLDQIAINSQFVEFITLPNSQISTNEQKLFITNSNTQTLSQYIILNEDTTAMSVEIDQNYQQIKNCEIIKLNGKVSNSETNQEIKEVPISLINRGINLFGIQKELNWKYEKDENKIHCFDLGQSWYSGQAFEIRLQQENKDIELQQTLVKQKESIEYSESIMEFDKDNLIQLMQNKIILISKSDFKTTEFQFDNKYSFINILYIHQELIYVQAIFNKQYLLKLISYTNSQFQLLDQQITFNYQIKKAYLSNNFFFIWVVQKVLVYNTNDEPKNLLNYIVVQNVNIPFSEGSMEFQYIKSNDVYQIIYLDESCLLQIFSLQISKSPYNSIRNIGEILREKFLYDPQNQICRNLFLKQNEIVVVISGTPSYKFSLVVLCQQQNICDITELNLLSEYQQYGKSEIDIKYPNSYLNENILSIIYHSDNGYDVLLYDLQSQSNQIGPNLAIAHSSSQSKQRSIISFVYNYNQQLHLLTSADDQLKLQHYQLRRSPQICIDKESVTENVKFLLKNSYQEKEVNITLKISPNTPDPGSDEKKGFPLWAILLIVGVVILIGIGITIWLCNKKKRTEDQYEAIP